MPYLLDHAFIGYPQFKLEPDTTTQHIITPVIGGCPALEQLSDEALAEIIHMRIIQEPVQRDGSEKGKMYIRLVMSDHTVASVLTLPYDNILAVSVMVSMCYSLLKNSTSNYSQKIHTTSYRVTKLYPLHNASLVLTLSSCCAMVK